MAECIDHPDGLEHVADDFEDKLNWMEMEMEMELEMMEVDGEDDVPAQRGLGARIRDEINKHYAHRYQEPRAPLSHPPPALPHILTVYKADHPNHFRCYLWVSPTTFDRILGAIEGNPVFVSRQNEQIPIAHQLGLVLYRLGHTGNAASLADVAVWAGVGKGTVLLVTRRVLKALTRCTVLLDALRWPTAEEIKEAKQWVEDASRCPEFRDGWCMVDGTLVPLYSRPHWYGKSYFDRKSNYSMSFQVSSTFSRRKDALTPCRSRPCQT